MGARLAVRTATGHHDDVAAVGGFHGGGLATDAPDSPHAGLGVARAEFVFGHADQDRSMPPEAVGRLGEALSAAGLVFINDVYAGARHGYTMADTTMFNEEATERHFRALEALSSGRSGDQRRLAGSPDCRRAVGGRHVGRRPGQPGARHGARLGGSGPGGAADDRAR